MNELSSHNSPNLHYLATEGCCQRHRSKSAKGHHLIRSICCLLWKRYGRSSYEVLLEHWGRQVPHHTPTPNGRTSRPSKYELLMDLHSNHFWNSSMVLSFRRAYLSRSLRQTGLSIQILIIFGGMLWNPDIRASKIDSS